MEKAGVNDEEVQLFQTEAMADDHDHLLRR
jgi:hypothetical protein